MRLLRNFCVLCVRLLGLKDRAHEPSFFRKPFNTGTPPAVVARLNALLAKATQSAGAKAFFDNSGSVAWSTSPEELGKFQAAETAKWGKVIKAAGIEPE